jgi:protocatechuate 4,5-dioxygenase alpha chain
MALPVDRRAATSPDRSRRHQLASRCSDRGNPAGESFGKIAHSDRPACCNIPGPALFDLDQCSNNILDLSCSCGRCGCAIERDQMTHQIPGTPIFDGAAAQRGYALNKMCFSFNSAENRAQFLRDEDAYCRKFDLTSAQRAAVAHRNVLELIEAGGNVYYLAKLAGIFGLNVQDIGAQQTGMTVEAFKAKLAAAGR